MREVLRRCREKVLKGGHDSGPEKIPCKGRRHRCERLCSWDVQTRSGPRLLSGFTSLVPHQKGPQMRIAGILSSQKPGSRSPPF